MRTAIAAFPLFSLALGAVNWSAFESCVTESGTAAVKTVSTSMSTTTVQQPDVLVKHTFHPQLLVTLRPFTKTWTRTFQETDTAVSTVTIHLTRTEMVPTSTIVNTYTQTHVSNIYTTIPVPAGFLPISNTTNSGYPKAQSLSSSSAVISSAASSTASSAASSTASSVASSTASSAASSTASSKSSAAPSSISTASAGFNMTASAFGSSPSAAAGVDGSADLDARGLKDIKQFARVVHCLKSVLVQKTVDTTITGTTQTSTLDQPTSTITVSTTSTTMVQPKFGRGKTAYTTAWTTVTKGYNAYSNKVVTAEVTSTVKAYAACQTNNVLGSVTSISGKAKYKTTVASSAQQCCEQCQQSSNCVGSAYQALLPLGGRCLIYIADTCPAQSANSLQYTPSKLSFGSFTVSNGVCGYMFSAGGQVSAHGHGWFP